MLYDNNNNSDKNTNENNNNYFNKTEIIDTYKILANAIDLEYKINQDKYNIILSFLNELLQLQNNKFIRITQFKNINQKYLLATEENLELINNYIDKFNQNGFKLNKKNKNPSYIIKNVCNKIHYSFSKKQNYLGDYIYTIVKK